jgi:hypothetical protein
LSTGYVDALDLEASLDTVKDIEYFRVAVPGNLFFFGQREFLYIDVTTLG